LIKSDNMTAVSYIRNMGGYLSKPCNAIARRIWEWAAACNIWLFCTFIAGSKNVLADEKSKLFCDRTEWKLDSQIFDRITTYYGRTLKIDLFASRLNAQLPQYVSWFPDPGACHVDAFTMPWDNDFYAFPPFSLVNRCLEKIQHDAVRGILIVTYWATQPWFPVMLHLLKRQPIKIPVHERSLHLPFKSDARHPLVGKLTLLVCLVSGN